MIDRLTENDFVLAAKIDELYACGGTVHNLNDAVRGLARWRRDRVEFRRATPQDAERILQFWTDSGASMGATDEEAHLRRVVTNPAAVFLLAMAGDEIVGTLLGAFDGWRGNMYRLVVHPARRRQGIGRQLVREVEAIFAEWGVRRITVLIEVDRPWAIAFWTSVGYPRDDRIVRHVGTFV